MLCPKCGSNMCAQQGKFGAFWSCPLCRTTLNLDGSPPNWPQMVHERIEDYVNTCYTYISRLHQDMSISLNHPQSRQLIEKIAYDFRSDTSNVERDLENFLKKPAYTNEVKTLSAVAGFVYWELSKASLRRANDPDTAYKFIDIALRISPTTSTHYHDMIATQAEIMQFKESLGGASSSTPALNAPRTNRQVHTVPLEPLMKNIPTQKPVTKKTSNKYKLALVGMLIIGIIFISFGKDSSESKPSTSTSPRTSEQLVTETQPTPTTEEAPAIHTVTSSAANETPKSDTTTSSETKEKVYYGNGPNGEGIKGHIGRNGKIYHIPGSTYYNRTKRVSEWFFTEEDAQNAGYRSPLK